MRATRLKDVGMPSRTAQVLLRELREECENVVALVRRVEDPGLSRGERDDLLGEISAAVVHLHAHTDGLDELICEME